MLDQKVLLYPIKLKKITISIKFYISFLFSKKKGAEAPSFKYLTEIIRMQKLMQ